MNDTGGWKWPPIVLLLRISMGRNLVMTHLEEALGNGGEKQGHAKNDEDVRDDNLTLRVPATYFHFHHE